MGYGPDERIKRDTISDRKETPMNDLFEKEIAYYEANKERLLKEFPWKFILIKDDQEYGLFDTDEAAYDAGIELFGEEQFFIQEIIEEDCAANFPACQIGLTHAGC